MMEERAGYGDPPLYVTCEACGEVLGVMDERAGRAVFVPCLFISGKAIRSNLVIDRAIHGVCAVCGGRYHWTRTEQGLDDLMARTGAAAEYAKTKKPEPDTWTPPKRVAQVYRGKGDPGGK